MTPDMHEHKIRKLAYKMIKSAYNVLEDEGQESMTAKSRKGSEIRFNKKNKAIGLIQFKHKDDISDPVSALLATRQFRKDLVDQSIFKNCSKYVKDVRLKDPEGRLIITHEFWKKELKPYLKDLEKMLVWKSSLKNVTKVDFDKVILNENKDQFDDDDKEYCVSTIETISAITEKDIDIQFRNTNQAYVYFDKSLKRYRIVIDPHDLQVDWKSSLEHEYGHVLWETSFHTFFKLIEKWIDDLIAEMKKEGLIKQ